MLDAPLLVLARPGCPAACLITLDTSPQGRADHPVGQVSEAPPSGPPHLVHLSERVMVPCFRLRQLASLPWVATANVPDDSGSPARRRWRKSSFSGNGGECVEVGQDLDAVAIRDTKETCSSRATTICRAAVMSSVPRLVSDSRTALVSSGSPRRSGGDLGDDPMTRGPGTSLRSPQV
jgi:Domain of unknown function (DUF397)